MLCDLKVTGLELSAPFLTFLSPICILVEQMTFLAFIEAVCLLHSSRFVSIHMTALIEENGNLEYK